MAYLDMVRFVEMDEKITLSQQIEHEVSPVILLNKFNVDSGEADQFIEDWSSDASFFKQQPGFISAQRHRGVGESSTFFNYAVWESTEHFKRAINRPEFQSGLGKYPPSTIASSHLFKKVAVPGICTE